MNEINYTLPMLPLRGMTMLPDMILDFDINRPKSVEAVEEALRGQMNLFLVPQLDPGKEEPGSGDLYQTGTVAVIKQVVRLPQNIVRILVEGKFRARLNRLVQEDPYLEAEVTIYEDHQRPDEVLAASMLRTMQEALEKYVAVNPQFSEEMLRKLYTIDDPVKLLDQLAMNLPMDFKSRQTLLEAFTIEERYVALLTIMERERQIAALNQEIQAKVKENLDKSQREYVLREQLKVIREELGEDTVLDEAEEFEEALKKLKADKDVKSRIAKEIDRFRTTAYNPSEGGVLRAYIETLLDMPWSKSGRDNKDIAKAEQILRADHYGLEKVKERILEYLAVRQLSRKGDSTILCLVGPPGTGKTSIARSIARALNKAYVRISLGGVHDEAEIRGHRKTYVGAMPGRIAMGLKSAGVNNPVMLLDEVDKIGTDYKGDPFAALLEVLDSEVNSKFRDNYLEIPIDLSNVFFIATANTVSTIPQPLLDRMDVIEISSYTENEKVHIAREHLIPKQLELNGFSKGQIVISDHALERLIMDYTREAGVRNLERRIGDICRRCAKKVVYTGKKNIKITEKNLEKYLGKPRYLHDEASLKDEIGVVRGLAWTSVGGETLSVEVNVLPGSGKFELTGQMGDVMKESAQAGISYIRSMILDYGIEKDFFVNNDIHIHIPEGAVPKDGPSAGITMATAMISAITKKPVRGDIALTGEITLRGRVLPVGGLKEKVLAAKIAKMKMVLVPKANMQDIEELEREITQGLDIRYVSTMDEVLKLALCE